MEKKKRTQKFFSYGEKHTKKKKITIPMSVR